MLGIVYVDRLTSLQLNMRFQIDAILERYQMMDCSIKKTPAPSGLVLLPADQSLQSPESQLYSYPEVVGSVMWVIRCTLLSAKFTRNTLCAHMTSWDSTHVAAATHMLKYLKYFRDQGRTFKKPIKIDRLSVQILSDANFGGELPCMKSTAAFLIVVETISTIMFMSKQQTTVSKSTMEAEYRSASNAAQVFDGYVNLLRQLGLIVNIPATLFVDNTATNSAIQTQATSFKLRHLLIEHAYLCELCFRGLISPSHVDGTHNPVDLGTKRLSAILALFWIVQGAMNSK